MTRRAAKPGQDPATLRLRPPAWTRGAACDSHPLGPTAWDNNTPAARQVCADCPVRLQCALEALNNAIPSGTWGGLTPDDRAAIARRRGFDRPGSARHGDRSRYNTCTDGPDGGKCPDCRESMRRWQSSYRATRPAARVAS
jgi:hypothetical protein